MIYMSCNLGGKFIFVWYLHTIAVWYVLHPPPPEIWLDLGSQDKKFPKQALTYRSGPLETTQNCQDNYIILAIGMKFLI